MYGLGDSSYVQYNWAAKKFARRLVSLGATQLLLALGDDQDEYGIESTLPGFMRDFVQVYGVRGARGVDTSGAESSTAADINKRAGIPDTAGTDRPDTDTADTADTDRPDTAESAGPLPPSLRLVRSSADMSPGAAVPQARLLSNDRVTAEDHFQDVRLISLECTTSANDVVEIFPENSPESVEAFLEYAGWTESADVPFFVESNYAESPVPEELAGRTFTLRQLLTHELDLHSVPKYGFFEVMSWFAPAGEVRDKFADLLGTEGHAVLEEYAVRARRSFLEVMHDLGISFKVPVDYVFDLLPRIRPRDYSVCLPSDAATPTSTSILVAMVRYRTRFIKAERIGYCTNYLSARVPGDRIKCRVRTSAHQVPQAGPAVFIGAGTGIAPCVAHVSARIAAGATENIVIFGFRARDKDFYLREVLESWAAQHKCRLLLATSREEPRQYVQHVLRAHGRLVWDYVSRGGAVFLSGAAKTMPRQVCDTLAAIVDASSKDTGTSPGKAYVDRMALTKRLIQDTWE